MRLAEIQKVTLLIYSEMQSIAFYAPLPSLNQLIINVRYWTLILSACPLRTCFPSGGQAQVRSAHVTTTPPSTGRGSKRQHNPEDIRPWQMWRNCLHNKADMRDNYPTGCSAPPKIRWCATMFPAARRAADGVGYTRGDIETWSETLPGR